MNRDLRNQSVLVELDGQPILKRPLIGVTMGREKSQRFFGLNLFIMNQTYVRTLEALGALPVMIPLHMSEASLRGIFERLDGVFLPGGEDIDPSNYGEERHPLLGATDKERDRTELLLTRWAIEAGMPVLGVCRGVQMINVACGGSLVQDLHSEFPRTRQARLLPAELRALSHQPSSRWSRTAGWRWRWGASTKSTRCTTRASTASALGCGWLRAPKTVCPKR
jgi:gamma-glutamyl-gamma-aminobutyrate hydrolase PuuD